MLSSVLRSPRAVQVNIEIMRAFVRFRMLIESNALLARKLAALERKSSKQFNLVFQAIRQLMAPPAVPPRRIGFHAKPDGRPGECVAGGNVLPIGAATRSGGRTWTGSHPSDSSA